MHKKVFKAKINGVGSVLKFRALNLADEQWVQKTYPSQGADAVLDLGSFAHVLYHQLVDKSPFSEIEVSDIDDQGRPVTIKLGGYKLFMSKIDGDEGKIQLLESFTALCKLSRPDIEESKQKAVKKKRKMKQLIFTASFILSLLIIIGAMTLLKA